MSEPGTTEPANQAQTAAVSNILQGKQPEKIEDEQLDQTAADNEREHDAGESHNKASDVSEQDGESQQDAEAGESQDADAGNDEPMTLNELAEELGADVADLYSAVIKLPNNESATLGEMKDAYKAHQVLLAEREQYDENRQRTENSLMVEKRQTEQLLRLGIAEGNITPKTLETLNRQHEQNMQREGRAMVEAIPSWKDPAVRRADFEGIAEMMSEYGFSQAEVLNIGQANIVKFLYDKSKEFNAKKFIKTQEKDAPRNTGKSRRPGSTGKPSLRQKIAAAKAAGHQEKTSLISALITGQEKLQ